MSYIPLIARIESLPPLPESVLKIEELFLNADPDIDDIVAIIEKDPSLTANILSKVNAPLYGFRKSIVSVLQAVALFGPTQIRSIVLFSSLERCFDIDLSPYGITTSQFSTISTMQSELVFQWYMGIDVDLARIATPIAFLLETGKILISKEVIENKAISSFTSDLAQYDISYVENMYAMMTTAQINALVFEHMNLNDSFFESMKYLDNEREIPQNIKELVTILQIVRTVVNIQEQLSEDSIEEATQLLLESGYNLEPFQRAIKRVQKKYME